MTRNKPAALISGCGLLTLAVLYLYWCHDKPYTSAPGHILAVLCILAFAWMCLRFVPHWMDWWADPREALSPEVPKYTLPKVFFGFLGVCLLNVLLAQLIFKVSGRGLNMWLNLDSRHYIDIAAEWYLSEGIIDRLVQLVFLPGYPVLLRLVHLIVPDWQTAGMLLSAVCFAGAGCLLYLLLRLDLPHADTIRCLRYVCLLPGAFFYTAPMSESLFLLCCVGCLYFQRTHRWPLAWVLGAYASFTRSLGLMLVAPLCMELIRSRSRDVRQWLTVLLVPLGFGVYCYINYTVSGDPFQFMEYQSNHWYQNLYLFFNTPAYMIDYVLGGADPRMILGMWIPNLLYIYGSLLVVGAAAKRLSPAYTAWFIAYYAIAIGATWLMSGPRYLMACPALPVALGLLTKHRTADITATGLCAAASLGYLCAFVLGWQVW